MLIALNWAKGLFRLWLASSVIWIVVQAVIAGDAFNNYVINEVAAKQHLENAEGANNIDGSCKELSSMNEYAQIACDMKARKSSPDMMLKAASDYKEIFILHAALAVVVPLGVIAFGLLARWIWWGFIK